MNGEALQNAILHMHAAELGLLPAGGGSRSKTGGSRTSAKHTSRPQATGSDDGAEVHDDAPRPQATGSEDGAEVH